MTPDYLALPDPDAERLIFSTLTTYAEDERSRYATVGLMADAVEKRLLWKCHVDPADGLPCRSFARWAQLCPYPYSTLYAAMRDVQALADVPPTELAQIPHGNFRTMKQLSTSVRRDPAVLAAAKSQSNDSLVAHIKAKHPEQHIERETVFKVPLNETQMADVEAAIAKAINRGCGSRSEALWSVAVDYLSTDEATLADVECKGAVQ